MSGRVPMTSVPIHYLALDERHEVVIGPHLELHGLVRPHDQSSFARQLDPIEGRDRPSLGDDAS